MVKGCRPWMVSGTSWTNQENAYKTVGLTPNQDSTLQFAGLSE